MEPLLLPTNPPDATPSQIPQAHDPRSKLFDSLPQIAMMILSHYHRRGWQLEQRYDCEKVIEEGGREGG